MFGSGHEAILLNIPISRMMDVKLYRRIMIVFFAVDLLDSTPLMFGARIVSSTIPSMLADGAVFAWFWDK
jgi:hypothetical protein